MPQPGDSQYLIERGQMGGWTEEESHSTRRDVRNILCHLGIYQGEKDYRNYYPLEVKDVCYQAANEPGLWYPAKKPGDMIQQGETLGVIKDYEGQILEVCRAEYGGVNFVSDRKFTGIAVRACDCLRTDFQRI